MVVLNLAEVRVTENIMGLVPRMGDYIKMSWRKAYPNLPGVHENEAMPAAREIVFDRVITCDSPAGELKPYTLAQSSFLEICEYFFSIKQIAPTAEYGDATQAQFMLDNGQPLSWIPRTYSAAGAISIKGIEDTSYCKIGASVYDCRVFVLHYIAENPTWDIINPLITPANPVVYAERQQIVRNFYTNCILSCLEPETFQLIINELTNEIESNRSVRMLVITEEMKQRAIPSDAAIYRLMICAYFALTSITKYGGEIVNIDKWIDKRMGSLKATLGQSAQTVTPPIAQDIKVYGAFLSSKLALRKAIFIPFLYDIGLPEEECRIVAQLRSPVKMVLRHYDMKTFYEALNFAIMCETEAHLYPQVCKQSVYVRNEMKKLEEDRSRFSENNVALYAVDYSCIFQKRPASLEVSNYQDLAYCAIYKNKKAQASWVNYTIDSITPTIPSSSLKLAIGRQLAATEGGGVVELDRDVIEYLRLSNKKKSDSPLLTFGQAISVAADNIWA